jgi:hypothetical protein
MGPVQVLLRAGVGWQWALWSVTQPRSPRCEQAHIRLGAAHMHGPGLHACLICCRLHRHAAGSPSTVCAASRRRRRPPRPALPFPPGRQTVSVAAARPFEHLSEVHNTAWTPCYVGAPPATPNTHCCLPAPPGVPANNASYFCDGNATTCYMVLPAGTWDTQRTKCQSLGGDLVVYNEWVAALGARACSPGGRCCNDSMRARHSAASLST